MKNILTLAIALSFVVSCLAPLHQASADENKMQENKMQENKMKEMHAEMMAKWQAYATPGDAHKVLGQIVGDWGYTVNWWNTPGSEPEVSTGESENEWIMDGRFLEMNYDGMSMGQKFKGMGIVGYDNAKKEYTSVWIDTMGTGIMTATGTYDAAAKTLTENGSYTDPMTGKGKSFRGVTTFVDKDSYKYELFTEGPDGKEFLMMEINYKREK
jgi:hypothetical protein